MNAQPDNTYSTLNSTILLPQYDKDKTVEILYQSSNCVLSSTGEEKSLLENYDDESKIPMPFVEPLLIYGTCMRLKGNPQHIRFSFWLNMYNSALLNLRAYCKSAQDDIPTIKIKRG